MHGELEEASASLGLDLRNLRVAADRSAQQIASARVAVADYLGTCDVGADATMSVLAYGSVARQEATPGSDLDYLVVAHEIGADPGVLRTYRLAGRAAQESVALSAPGTSGLFGAAISNAELVNSIGLDADSNLNHSRRVLTLQESVSLTDEADHDRLLRAILGRYLEDYRSREQSFAPRFLLNDITRYWRTVAVDYQAKRWVELESKKWGSRYLKLRTTRKLAYASNLAAALHPLLAGQQTSVDLLVEQFKMPALARLAQLQKVVGDDGREALQNVLTIADEVIGWFADEDARDMMNKVSDPSAEPEESWFGQARLRSIELQQALVTLFFDGSNRLGGRSLSDLSRSYLTF